MCDRVRTSWDTLTQLSMTAHPAVVATQDAAGGEAIEQLFRVSSNHALVEAISYRKDPEVQFCDVKGSVQEFAASANKHAMRKRTLHSEVLLASEARMKHDPLAARRTCSST